jgi:type IV pilus assembly protein PilC
MLVYIVPKFESMYADLGSELPGITKFIISMSTFLGNYLVWFLLGIVVFIILFIVLFKNVQSFRKVIQTLVMKVPVFGNMIIYSEVSVFAKTFSNLINHSVFITDSIDILSKITNNEVYKGLIYNAAQNLIKGESLSAAFEDHWAFPDIAYQMLITGEKTGRLGIMLEKVAAYFQEQHRNMINAMKSLIEPILIVFLALIVGGILLSVILPMFDMYSQIG